LTFLVVFLSFFVVVFSKDGVRVKRFLFVFYVANLDYLTIERRTSLDLLSLRRFQQKKRQEFKLIFLEFFCNVLKLYFSLEIIKIIISFLLLKICNVNNDFFFCNCCIYKQENFTSILNIFIHFFQVWNYKAREFFKNWFFKNSIPFSYLLDTLVVRLWQRHPKLSKTYFQIWIDQMKILFMIFNLSF